MNSDETAYSMLPVKYPFLFPITTSAWFNYLYKKLHIHMNSNRKHEHHRLLSLDLDDHGNLVAIDHMILSKVKIDTKEIASAK